jgi:antitoxin PrlF
MRHDVPTMSEQRSAVFVTSRLGVKSQTVLPKPVREALGIGPGDQIGYSIREGRVMLTAVRASAPPDDPFACFEEWASEADTLGYASL